MSNIAPYSLATFDPHKHILRQDLVFRPPGVHIKLKWTKTMQDNSAHHWVQLPQLNNFLLCSVRALRQLLQSRPLPPHAPLFANSFPPHNQCIDIHFRDALKLVLSQLSIPLEGHGFHSFRRSGATLAFHNNIPLQKIMQHGLWRSSAIWTYLQNTSLAPSIIPLTFTSISM